MLWDLRNSGDITGGQADFLVFDAIYGLSSNPDFLEFRDAMMAADDGAYNGDHNDLIQDIFADWGIGSHASLPLSVYISGNPGMFEGTSDTFTAHASGGTPPYIYAWYYKHENDFSWSLIPNENSSTYYHTAGSPNGEYLKVELTDYNFGYDEDQFYIVIAGMGGVTVEEPIPKEVIHYQNYPNPFNPSTMIRFGLPSKSMVHLEVFNIMGQRVAILLDGEKPAGFHEVEFNGQNLASGIYITRMRVISQNGESHIREQVMNLIK